MKPQVPAQHPLLTPRSVPPGMQGLGSTEPSPGPLLLLPSHQKTSGPRAAYEIAPTHTCQATKDTVSPQLLSRQRTWTWTCPQASSQAPAEVELVGVASSKATPGPTVRLVSPPHHEGGWGEEGHGQPQSHPAHPQSPLDLSPHAGGSTAAAPLRAHSVKEQRRLSHRRLAAGADSREHPSSPQRRATQPQDPLPASPTGADLEKRLQRVQSSRH